MIAIILDKIALFTQNYLTTLVFDEAFRENMILAFGDLFNAETAESLRQQWIAGNFEGLPTVEIRSAAEINGANGAFASATNTIYLSREFLTQNASNPGAVTSVLLEEIGHYLDSRINASDASGDEGAIFSAVVQGVELEVEELQRLKAEYDTATISLDGQLIQIEQSTANYQPIGSEFRVDINGAPTGRTTGPQVANAANGDFVVVWQTPFSNTDIDLYFRRFNANGTPKDSFDRSIAISVRNEFTPTVAMAADGRFVVTWTETNSSGDQDVYFQRFSAAGDKLGGSVLVTTFADSKNQSNPDIAMFDNGDFVITWTHEFSATDQDVFMRGFRSDGTPFTGDLAVATSSVHEFDSSIDARPIGEAGATSLVVSWTSGGTGNEDVFFQRYDGNLSFLGSGQANVTTTNSDDESSVALDGAGNFAIAWTHEFSSTGGDDDIRLRRFNANGTALTSFDQIVAQPSGDQDEPVVAMSNDGRFVVGYEDDTIQSVNYIEYSSNGTPVGFPQQYDVNHSFEDNPAIAINGNGAHMVIAADDDFFNSFDPTARKFQSSNQNDAIVGGGGNDIINGGAGNDTLNGRGGNDTLIGKAGNDLLLGQSGNDKLVGVTGADQLTGGTGKDLFVFNAKTEGKDTITIGVSSGSGSSFGRYCHGLYWIATTLLETKLHKS